MALLRNEEAGPTASGNRPEIQTTLTVEFSFPDPTAVKGRVLADMLRGARITHLDVWQRHGSSRAAHHVLMLRKAGFPIVTREIEAPTSDGRIARIAEYSLPTETIEAAGERGQRYVAECARIEAERRAA